MNTHPQHDSTDDGLYGLLAEFNSVEELLAAARCAHGLGYRRAEGYAPFPVDGLAEAMGHHGTIIPLVTLVGGITGAGVAFATMYYASVISYPLNVGGRPLNSWPAFIPITFELAVLGASLSAFFGMLIANGLPRPYHPLFNVPEFAAASRDRFFLCIEAADRLFEYGQTRQFLESLPGSRVFDVPS